MVIVCSTLVRCASPLGRALADIAAMGFATIDWLVIDGRTLTVPLTIDPPDAPGEPFTRTVRDPANAVLGTSTSTPVPIWTMPRRSFT